MQNTKKAIKQKDSFGCGIACVAFVNNVDYETAKRNYFGVNQKAVTTGYLCKDMVMALQRAGKEYCYKYIKKPMALKEDTIVFIKRSKRYPDGHYLAKSKLGWMDPWINFDIKRPNVEEAQAGFRKRLPGRPIYAIIRA
ncbi:MAG: hypothetical protein KGH57_04345 [Candidatus Micrarchaeota archaeon]|nr:hypothetical protein [Candidatus Micrarchaeota archaeon]